MGLLSSHPSSAENCLSWPLYLWKICAPLAARFEIFHSDAVEDSKPSMRVLDCFDINTEASSSSKSAVTIYQSIRYHMAETLNHCRSSLHKTQENWKSRVHLPVHLYYIWNQRTFNDIWHWASTIKSFENNYLLWSIRKEYLTWFAYFTTLCSVESICMKNLHLQHKANELPMFTCTSIFTGEDAYNNVRKTK